VCILVTEGTIQSTVCSFAALQQLKCITMASGTVLRRDIFAVSDRHWLVSLVTLSTFGLSHVFCMRIVAIRALWNVTVVRLMTGRAIHLCVQGLAGCQFSVNPIMTRRTVLGCDITTVSNRQRAVGLVTLGTFCLGHVSSMRLVTVSTLGNLPVGCFVTSGAVDFFMLGDTDIQSTKHIVVTGRTTDRRQIGTISNFQRLVSFMTLSAISLNHLCGVRLVAL